MLGRFLFLMLCWRVVLPARLALLTQPWFVASGPPSRVSRWLPPSSWARLVLGALAVVGFSFGVAAGVATEASCYCSGDSGCKGGHRVLHVSVPVSGVDGRGFGGVGAGCAFQAREPRRQALALHDMS